MHQKKAKLTAAAMDQANKNRKTKTTINLSGWHPPSNAKGLNALEKFTAHYADGMADVASPQWLKQTIAQKNSNCVAWHDRGGIPKPCKRVKTHQKKRSANCKQTRTKKP